MANWYEPTAEQRAEWAGWVASRPERVRLIAERFPPWKIYWLADPGQRVTIYSFNEDGTVTVNVTGEFNRIAFERRVFGIPPEQLTECDLPTPGEPLGVGMNQDEARRFLSQRYPGKN